MRHSRQNNNKLNTFLPLSLALFLSVDLSMSVVSFAISNVPFYDILAGFSKNYAFQNEKIISTYFSEMLDHSSRFSTELKARWQWRMRN